ncbi:MAG: hypothetical protein ABIJ61_13550, partial [bacterium]
GYVEYVRYTRESLLKANDLFRRALREDSTFLLGYTASVDTYSQLQLRGWGERAAYLDSARSLIARAERIHNAGSSVAFLRSKALMESVEGQKLFEQFGLDSSIVDTDFSETERQKRADELALVVERFDAARDLFDSALSISSSCPVTRNNRVATLAQLGDLLIRCGEIEKGSQVLVAADSLLRIEISENSFFAPFYVNLGFLHLAQYEAAEAGAKAQLVSDPMTWLDRAETALKWAIKLSDTSATAGLSTVGHAYYNLACVEAKRSQQTSLERAVTLLKRAADYGGFNFCEMIGRDPDLEAVRRVIPIFRHLRRYNGCSGSEIASNGVKSLSTDYDAREDAILVATLYR